MKKKINFKPEGFTIIKNLGNDNIRFGFSNKTMRFRVINIKDGIAQVPPDIKSIREDFEKHGFVGFLAFLDEKAQTNRQQTNPKYWWLCPMIENHFLEQLNGRQPKYEEIVEYCVKMNDCFKPMDIYGELINE